MLSLIFHFGLMMCLGKMSIEWIKNDTQTHIIGMKIGFVLLGLLPYFIIFYNLTIASNLHAKAINKKIDANV
jgi:uncharacterized membrane protein